MITDSEFPDTWQQEHQRARTVVSRISVRSLVFMGLSLFFIAMLIALNFIDTEEGLQGLEPLIITTSLLAIVSLLVWIWTKFRRVGVSPAPLFHAGRFSLQDLTLVIPLLLFSVGLVSTVLFLITLVDMELFTRVRELTDSEFLAITGESTWTEALGILLLVGVAGPFVEEVVFRGVMVERLGAKYGFSSAVVLSSVLFGFLHVDVIGAMLFGFAMCLIYLKTGSLLVPILIHMLNNTLVIVYIYLSSRMDWSQFDGAAHLQQFAWFYIMLLILSTAWLAGFIRRHWQLVHEKEPCG